MLQPSYTSVLASVTSPSTSFFSCFLVDADRMLACHLYKTGLLHNETRNVSGIVVVFAVGTASLPLRHRDREDLVSLPFHIAQEAARTTGM